MSANSLESIPPSSQSEESLSTLQELYLTGNNLNENCGALLVGHQNLRVLHIAYNQLLSFPARCISLAFMLVILMAYKLLYNVTIITTPAFSVQCWQLNLCPLLIYWIFLTYIIIKNHYPRGYLQCNMIEFTVCICFYVFSKLSKLELLEELNLSGNKLKTIPSTVSSCKRLHTLIAHSNHITVFPEILNLPEIKVRPVFVLLD